MTDEVSKRISTALRSNLQFEIYKRGVSQSAFCKQTGFANSTISAICTGAHVPNADTIAKIANALGVTIEHLLRPPNETPFCP